MLQRISKQSKSTVLIGVLLVCALSFIIGSLRMGVWHDNTPKAGFFPLIVGGVLFMAVVALFLELRGSSEKQVDEVIARSEVLSGIGEEDSDVEETQTVLYSKKALLVTGIVLVTALSLNLLGFRIATALMLFVILCFVESYKWWIAVLIGVGVSLLMYFIFATELGVHLPISRLGI